MKSSTPADQSAKAAAKRAPRRSRARPTGPAAGQGKADAGGASAASATAAAAAPAAAQQAGASDDLMAGFWRSIGGVGVAMPQLARIQADYVARATGLWNTAAGAGVAAAAPIGDRRFNDPAWRENPAAAFMARLYLLNAQTLTELADSVQADAKTQARIRFAVQQWVDAASPGNVLALNPEALQKALNTGGESLAQGLQLLLEDVRKGHVSQTDEAVFEVGRNVATTPGQVVFENELIQLIEYAPLTAKVHERPMLFVPPCINKFYILDLQPENSLIRHTVAQGHRTFVVSWRNPDESIKDRRWDDYIEHGAVAAIRAVQAISGQPRINTLGFCVGGTILCTALAVLAARGEQAAHALTLLTTLLDFEDTGVLDIFIDEPMVKLREMTIGAESPTGPGLLKGQDLATTFSFLRPNDLVWNYVVGNYLKGEAPPAFDLLYWNGDSTNLPGPMYCWYLRHTYLQNDLKRPGRLTVCGEAVDLGLIEAPVFIYGSREDHIVPWQGAYRSVPLFKGRCAFVLGASGHIAGVINPPAKGKRSHWTNSATPADAQAWLAGATEHPGSWWPVWTDWLKGQGGRLMNAPRAPGAAGYAPIEPAPGRYVKAKA